MKPPKNTTGRKRTPQAPTVPAGIKNKLKGRGKGAGHTPRALGSGTGFGPKRKK